MIIDKKTGKFLPTHGFSGTDAYQTWRNILRRCYDTSNPDYKHYGGRGIKVCEEWHDIRQFAEWFYKNKTQPQLTIDRIDNDGNYTPSNCRMTTRLVQGRNTRRNVLTMNKAKAIRILYGEYNMYELAEMFKISSTLVNSVIKNKVWAELS